MCRSVGLSKALFPYKSNNPPINYYESEIHLAILHPGFWVDMVRGVCRVGALRCTVRFFLLLGRELSVESVYVFGLSLVHGGMFLLEGRG